MSDFSRRTKQGDSLTVALDTHEPLVSVGLVCVCGQAVAAMESVATACACGRVWLISVMQIGGPHG